MMKNFLLCAIAGNFLPMEDQQRYATPAHFAQGLPEVWVPVGWRMPGTKCS